MIVLLLGEGGFSRLQLRQIRAAMDCGRLPVAEVWLVGAAAGKLAVEDGRGARPVDSEVESFLDDALETLPRSARLIPPPVAPHLIARWLARKTSGALAPLPGPFGLPFEHEGEGVRYLSAAAWRCPVDCQAPETCPMIALPRHWHLPSLLRRVARERGLQALVFVPRGPSSGAEAIAAGRLQAGLRRARRGGRFLVGTAAPCHAAASILTVSD